MPSSGRTPRERATERMRSSSETFSRIRTTFFFIRTAFSAIRTNVSSLYPLQVMRLSGPRSVEIAASSSGLEPASSP